jgi:hypothetical protein
MEAGIEPAGPPENSPNLYTTALRLLVNLCDSLSNISHHTHVRSEQKIIEKLLSIVNSHLTIVASALSSTTQPLCNKNKCTKTPFTTTDFDSKISILHNSLWKHLSKPLSSTMRNYIFNCLIQTDHLISILKQLTENPTEIYKVPPSNKSSRPSIRSQLVSEPTQILDPYTTSLTQNYYYLISPMNSSDEPEDHTPPPGDNRTETSSPKLAQKTPSNHEDSIDAISDIFVDMEEDELPVQMQPKKESFQPASQVQPSFFKHRFAIYRKCSMPYLANAPSQVKLTCSPHLLNV